MTDIDISWQTDRTMRYSIAELSRVASLLLRDLQSSPIWLFDAPMGAGKTTLIRELARQLGIEEEVNSPTFAIVNEYHTPEGLPLYHIDAYRIEAASDLQNIGISDYLYSGHHIFVEWPALFEPFLPDEGVVRIRIDVDGDVRALSLESSHSPYIYDPR